MRNEKEDLIGSTEDVRIVLLEAAHAGESTERAAQLVPMQDTEIGHPYRQLAIRSLPGLKHQAIII